MIALIASRGVVPLLIVAALLAGLEAWRTGRRLPRPEPALTAATGGLLAWCAVSSFWAPDPAGSLVLTLRVGAIFGAGLVLHALGRELDDASRRRIGLWFAAGLLISLAIMAIEASFDFPLLRLLEPARLSDTAPAVLLNRGAMAMAMLCWPAVAVLWHRGARPLALAVPAMVALVLSLLISLSAGLGLIAGTVTAVVALGHRKAGRALLVVAAVAALIGSPVAAKYFYAQGWQSASWLPASARHRVRIWHVAVEHVEQRPLFGWGFDSARALPRQPAATGDGDRPLPALHPHNGPLQVLLELGVVGGLLALALLWQVIRLTQSLAPPDRVCAQALFVSTLTISLTAFGLWQNQWLALMVMSALVTAWTART